MKPISPRLRRLPTDEELLKRAVRRGFLLERRGPDGRVYVALSSEGWERFRSAG